MAHSNMGYFFALIFNTRCSEFVQKEDTIQLRSG